jgi:peroxiredoxin
VTRVLLGPQVGDQAPTPTVKDLRGRPYSLDQSWKERPALISFLRYFGCPFCQSWVGRLARKADLFDQEGVNVVLVGQGTVGEAMGFTGPRRVPFDMLVDEDRSAYRAFGLVEGSSTELLKPSVAVAWVGVHVRGEGRQGGSHGGAVTQLPGTFIVDTDGVVRFVHRNADQADDPDASTVLGVCREVRRAP